MPECVSPLAAFVLRHGEVAREVLFRDVDEEDELPGITPEERAAISQVEPQLREEWIAILTACREAICDRAAGHPCEATLRLRKTRPDTMWRRDHVELRLSDDWRSTCGVTLRPWGAESHKLYLWVWMQRNLQARAEAALDGVDIPGLWRGETGSFFLTLEPPQEGEAYTAVGARVADALWPLIRPIAEALAER